MKLVGPLVVLLLLVLAACGSGPQVLDRGGTDHVLVGGSSDGGSDAQIYGELAMVGHCLGVVRDGESYVVVWPTGTRLLDGDALGVDVPHVGRLEQGEQVELSGGYFGPPFPDRVPHLPHGCPDEEVAVANSDQSR